MANLCPPLHTSEWKHFQSRFNNIGEALHVWKTHDFRIPSNIELAREYGMMARLKRQPDTKEEKEKKDIEFNKQYDDYISTNDNVYYLSEEDAINNYNELKDKYPSLYFELTSKFHLKPNTVGEKAYFTLWKLEARDVRFFPGIKFHYTGNDNKTDENSKFYINGLGKKSERNSSYIEDFILPEKDNNDIDPSYRRARISAENYLRNNGIDIGFKDYKEYVVDSRPNDKLTFDEYVQHIKNSGEKGRLIGKVFHKHQEIGATPTVENKKELSILESRYGNTDKDIKELEKLQEISEKYYENHVKPMVTGALDFDFELPVSITGLDYTFNDGLSEVKSDTVTGAIDAVFKYDKHKYRIIDFKTGYINPDEPGPLLRKDSKLRSNNYTHGMLKIVLNAIQFKSSVDRNAKFDDIALYNADLKNGNNYIYSIMGSESRMSELQLFLDEWAYHFRTTQSEWYKNNKDLFSSNNYIAVPEEDKKLIDNQQAIDDLMVSLNNLVERRMSKGLTEAEEDQVRSIIDSISFLTTKSTPLSQGTFVSNKGSIESKGMHFLETWTLGIKDKSNPLVQVINKLHSERSFKYNKEYLSMIQEYQRRLTKLSKKTAVHVGVSYKDIYDFMWIKKEDSEDGIIKGGEYLTTWREEEKWKSLTAEQKDFVNYHRWFIRYNLFATMDPREGVKYINSELRDRKDLSEDDIKYLKNQIDELNKLPDLNKFATAGMKWFTYYEGWTPRVIRQPEEEQNIQKHLGNIFKNTWRFNQDDLASVIKDRDSQNYIGLLIKYMGKANAPQLQETDYTYNPEIIAVSFYDNMSKKRHFDDVHNLSNAIVHILTEINHKANSKEIKNIINYTSEFANQIADMKANELNETTKRIVSLKNLVGFTSLALRFLSPMRTGVTQQIGLTNRAVAGTISRLLADKMGIDKKNIDFSGRNVAKVTSITSRLMKDMVWGRDKLNKNKMHFFNNIFGNTVESYTNMAYNKSKMVSAMSFLLGKKITLNGLYFMYRIWDIITYSQYLSDQLLDMKVPSKDGKTMISMYDAYEFNEEKQAFEYVGGARGKTVDGRILTDITFKEVETMKTVGRKSLGEMRNEERSIAENTLLGLLFFQFKWFYPGMMNSAWKSKQKSASLTKWMENGEYFVSDENHVDYNKNFSRYTDDTKTTETELYKKYKESGTQILPVLIATQMTDEGYMRTLGTVGMMLKLYAKNPQKFKDEWSNLSDYQKQNIILAGVKLAQWISLGVLVGLAFGGGGDDDKGNKWSYNLSALQKETGFEFIFTDLQGHANTLTSSATIKTTADFLGALYEFSGALITGDKIETGPHAGWYRGLPMTLKKAPGTSIFYDVWRTKYDYDEFEKTLSKWEREYH